MLEWPASVQPLFIGGTLLWSGGLKCFGRSARRSAERSALPSLVGAGRALAAYRLTGVLELALAAVLLLPPAYAAETAAAAVLGLGFLGYLTYARVAAPDSSCGCLSRRRTPVTWRSFARAGLPAAYVRPAFELARVVHADPLLHCRVRWHDRLRGRRGAAAARPPR